MKPQGPKQMRSGHLLNAAAIATLAGVLVGIVPIAAQATTLYSSWGSIAGGY
jgi:hypothetical protein